MHNRIVVPPILLTARGKEFNFLHPWDFDYDIEDIAHALSNTCRFSGHTREFYSVAQHSVIVATQAPKHMRFAALMHDASEAFLGDVPTPLKCCLPEYQRIERDVQDAIEWYYRLPRTHTDSIKGYDLRALATEKRDLMPQTLGQWAVLYGIKPLDATITPLPPRDAKALFLQSYEDCR